MPPIADCAQKRQQNIVGGGGHQLTTLAADPPQVALEPVGVVLVNIERNHQEIVVRVATPCKPSADKNKQRASITSQLAADFNAFKLGDGHGNQYGAQIRAFLRHAVPSIEIGLRLTPL